MQKYFKLSFIIFIISTICITVYCVAAIYFNDPLQVWHKPFYGTEGYSHIRLSAKALIRNNEFDSVIIGNSHSENTSAKMTEKLLGGKFFNLSASGSTMREKDIILRYLFKQKNIKKVVYITDRHYIQLEHDSVNYPISTFDFLYNENQFDDYKVYVNEKYLPCALGFVKTSRCVKAIKDMDRPYAWDGILEYTKRFNGFDNWINNKDNGQIKKVFQDILETPKEIAQLKNDKNYEQELHKYIDEYLIEIIKLNPQIEFDVVISPVSDLELATEIRTDVFEKQELFLKYLVEKGSECENLNIYAFDNLSTIGKIEDFKDLTHFKTWVNEYIIDSIAQNKHQLNESNIDKYLKDVYNKALDFDFEKYRRLVETL